MFSWKEGLITLGAALFLAGVSVPGAGLLFSKGRCVLVTTANSDACFGYLPK